MHLVDGFALQILKVDGDLGAGDVEPHGGRGLSGHRSTRSATEYRRR